MFGDSIVALSSRFKMSVKKKFIDIMRRTERTIIIDISLT
jgi:hypothetical protein